MESETALKPSGRVVIIGAGNVGASIAYAVLNQKTSKEILIIDIMEEFAKAQVADLMDAAVLTGGIIVRYASYSDLTDGDIIVVTCGAAQKEGQSRNELLAINAGIIRSVLNEIKKSGKQVYILMVTNPVDTLTYLAVKESGQPAERVFGSGTHLDSARLRKKLAWDYQVQPDQVSAYTLGEHGDSSFPALSLATVDGMALSAKTTVDAPYYEYIANEVRSEAYEIIAGKKATYYGIGNAIEDLVQAILLDENKIFPVTTLFSGEFGINDVCLGLPRLINAKGYSAVSEPALSEYEKELLAKSALAVKEVIAALPAA